MYKCNASAVIPLQLVMIPLSMLHSELCAHYGSHHYKWFSAQPVHLHSPIFLCCLVDTCQHPTPSEHLQVFSVEQEDYSTLINSIYGCIRAFIGDIDATALKKADWLFGPIFFILFIFIMFFVMLTVLIAVSLPSHQVSVPRVFLAPRWVHSNSI